jgi:hypothetical protein
MLFSVRRFSPKLWTPRIGPPLSERVLSMPCKVFWAAQFAITLGIQGSLQLYATLRSAKMRALSRRLRDTR